MSPIGRRPVLLGMALLLMGVGCAGPWATAHTWDAGVVAVSGMDHGGRVVLLLCGLILLALIARRLWVARGLALVALALLLVTAYELPGSLLYRGAWRADLAWGIGVALLGSAIVLIAARPAHA